MVLLQKIFAVLALLCCTLGGNTVAQCFGNKGDSSTLTDLISTMSSKLTCSGDMSEFVTKLLLLETFHKSKIHGELRESLEKLKNASTCTQDVPKTEKGDQVVAFSARVSGHLDKLKPSQTVIFGTVVTNIGDSYDPSTGVFTCPQEGVYQFFVTLLVNSNKRTEAVLTVNGVIKMYLYTSAGTVHSGSQGSNTVILQLNANDKLDVRMYDSRGEYVHCCWSTFNGHLLKQTN